ncbi:WXG100 family type VII secretion target [Faecalicatena contorta]|uniref:ESAT-6-like protein n=1 Tax=Faecalicatena fissicatena TaxID=290055 RepID=A0ABS2EAX4_9FIRM|nr:MULTISPECIES: WXG100 family type VII secretion target [Faecalicatena]MBM6685635.1 WXG100 family type VII secretion target [Faecalicatena contorta]MBM6711324.1 WXG100 family type VII secretion target [Faecalicatena contorta]MBM6738796.1 WXG100 family type VII secretion target [Faecalicatena fissicatena]HIX99439.1 WXG100 family type VII secretion target [Candidatus Dorea intestinigallinarum]
MAQTVKIDTARLERDCSQFESGIRELEKCLQEMKESVEELHQSWEGPSHDTFVSNFNQSFEQMVQAGQSLTVYLESLRQSQRDYTGCEEQVRNLIQKL